jgi:hypothetical protein
VQARTICEHGVLGLSVRRYRKRCPQSHAGQSGGHATWQRTLFHAEHPHPHIYIRKRWPGNLILPAGFVRSDIWFLNPAMAVQLRARPLAKFQANLAAGSGRLMRPMLPLATAQPDCRLAEADTYVPGVVCARQQLVKQRHGAKAAGALWIYVPDHARSTSWRRIKPNKMTPVESEPTPFRNGALSHRLKPLGQSVFGKIGFIHGFGC